MTAVPAIDSPQGKKVLMKKIAFVTYAKQPHLTEDDALAPEYLRKLGIQAVATVWDDATMNWGDFEAVVLRSCWDYHHKPRAFRLWIDRLVSSNIPLWNPARIVRWNMDKIYLRDLAARGVSIPQTVWLEAGAEGALVSILERNHFAHAVIKPAISATAYLTFQTSPAQAHEHQSQLNAILRQSGALVQEFVPEITTHGEWSLMFFGGKFSHAVLKQPQAGDFRVQTDFGGSYRAATPPPQFIAQAEEILQRVDPPLLYARADGVQREEQFLLIELELIEPALFLRADPAAPARFAETIARLV